MAENDTTPQSSTALQECQASLKQREEQGIENLKKQANLLEDNVKQQFAKSLESSKKLFTDVFDSFSSAVTGYENPEDVDIDTILDPLKAAFEPIIQILAELKIEVPGLSLLTSVFNAVKTAEKEVKNVAGDVKALLTGRDRSSSKGLQEAATTIMMSISMLFLNIIVGMIAKILELLTTLIDTLVDLDKLPYPLNLVTKALKALPKIILLARNLPTLLGMIFDAICIKYNTAIADAKEAIDNGEVKMPEVHMPCPEKEVTVASSKIVDAAANQFTPFVPKKLV